MRRILLLLLLCPPWHEVSAFDLPGMNAASAAALSPHNVPVPVAPRSRAELELAARHPGAAIVSLNRFLPPAVAALFNREPGFGGPNCFHAAFTAAGQMPVGKPRHVGNPEADQLLSMYYVQAPVGPYRPGDILVLNKGDHAVYFLGGGLVFHKKSYLKEHIYRITRLEEAYEPEPYEWKPGIFEGSSPFSQTAEIRSIAAWRPSGAQYGFGPAGAAETAKAEAIIFLAENVAEKASRWALGRELGYFTEALLENLVSDWRALGESPNPVLRAYYYQLHSLRDQANQSIETELLSSPYAQAHADETLKSVWLPRNACTRGLISRLLGIYGRDPAALDAVMDEIEKNYDRAPLPLIRSAGRRACRQG